MSVQHIPTPNEEQQQDHNQTKEQLQGDSIFNKYIKGPKSVYAYVSDVNSLDMFKLLQSSENGKDFEYSGYWWTKKDSIVFRKTKEEHEAWGKKGTRYDNRKVVDERVIAFDGMDVNAINSYLFSGIKDGFEPFGKDLSSQCVVLSDGRVLFGMVKKQ